MPSRDTQHGAPLVRSLEDPKATVDGLRAQVDRPNRFLQDSKRYLLVLCVCVFVWGGVLVATNCWFELTFL